jgi:UrcA family protein
MKPRELKMNQRKVFAFVPAAFLALATSGLFLMSNFAIAQEADEAMEEIVVRAPVAHREAETLPNGMKVDVVQVLARISYADLDLTRYKDVMALEARIESRASESCEHLAGMFPLDMDKRAIRLCASESIADTRKQMKSAIEEANTSMAGVTQ